MSTCTLQEIVTAVASDEDSLLSSETGILTELLVALNDKGIIIFIQNQQQPQNSWIVVDTEKILKEIDGILFAPRVAEHRQVASSSGIVLASSLKQLFPHYNLEMLIESFLQIFELCDRVNLSGSTTNLHSIETSSPASDIEECFLFFPSLIDFCKPSVLPGDKTLNFGWTIICQPKFRIPMFH